MSNSRRMNIGTSSGKKKRPLSSYASFALFVAAAAIALSAIIMRAGKSGVVGTTDGQSDEVSSRTSSASATLSADDTADSTTDAATAQTTKVGSRATQTTRKQEEERGQDSDELEDSEETAAIQVMGDVRNYVRPSEGPIIKPYSMDALVFSKTMNDWRVHTGLDLAAEKGEVVKSAAEGKVAGVSDDSLYGTTVVVNQNDGLMVYYRGLNKETAVRSGENIAAGATIGTVGEIPCESADGTHLHIEVKRENKYLDPAKALGIK